MGAGHVILWDFAFIGFALLGEEIYGETLLQECVAFVFLVGEDGVDGGVAPFVFTPRGQYSVSV